MSQLFKTDLEEYARQCTLQRRRYEECLQQAQQSCTVMSETMRHDTLGNPIEVKQVDTCVEQSVQSCMIELLEMPVEPLGWDDEDAALGDTRTVSTREPQGQGDRAQVSHQTSAKPAAKSPSPVGFGAP
ncbi:hypothetical protein [Stenomitos frigidus]|uniref:Uncharacterized protein n=1 Tax=Stenomitos frigidus ULC18 TaxID=2107698 RepID=A0A2T1EI95_9CYAN|nr:hypothetical protein [Stenomitos frigidus]PSB32433.1 hypothetical protein C7B82_05400 [Stenomitos frigidus ULC18]